MSTYICTVGSGTAGKCSNVAEGIMSAIRRASPDAIVLVPSNTADSLAVADIVKEGVDGICPEIKIVPISDHDDLMLCRQEISRVIRTAGATPAERHIILNPTSGTKQMTTAAVLAAIDENLENIEYITGERRDGVIITGQEKISRLSARRFIAEKYRSSAVALIKGGAPHAAARLLDPYKDIYPLTYAAAMTNHHWRRFDYGSALNWAKCGDNEEWQGARRALERLRRAENISLERIVDMRNYAFFYCIEQDEAEEALAIIYRVVEACAKLRLKEMHVDCENLQIAAVTGNPELKIANALKNKLRVIEQSDGKIQPGLKLSLEILSSTGFAFTRNFLNSKISWPVLMERNNTRYGHGTKFIDLKDVQALFRLFNQALEEAWPRVVELYDAIKYPKLQSLINQEDNHA